MSKKERFADDRHLNKMETNQKYLQTVPSEALDETGVNNGEFLGRVPENPGYDGVRLLELPLRPGNRARLQYLR